MPCRAGKSEKKCAAHSRLFNLSKQLFLRNNAPIAADGKMQALVQTLCRRIFRANPNRFSLGQHGVSQCGDTGRRVAAAAAVGTGGHRTPEERRRGIRPPSWRWLRAPAHRLVQPCGSSHAAADGRRRHTSCQRRTGRPQSTGPAGDKRNGETREAVPGHPAANPVPAA